MKISKTVRKGGFEYRAMLSSHDWHYEFRPVGAQVFMPFDGRKPKLISLLSAGQLALVQYLAQRTRYGDVVRAQQNLEQAKRLAASKSVAASDDFDPGGRRNNPGRVSREIRQRPSCENQVETTQNALESAIGWRTLIEADPFDVQAWRDPYLPESER